MIFHNHRLNTLFAHIVGVILKQRNPKFLKMRKTLQKFNFWNKFNIIGYKNDWQVVEGLLEAYGQGSSCEINISEIFQECLGPRSRFPYLGILD